MKLTKEGRKFILATFLIFFAALNTGNNLIYLIFAMMIGIWILSIVFIKINMRGLSLEMKVKGVIYANQDSLAEIILKNNNRFIPSYSIRILLPEGLEGRTIIPYVSAGETVSETLSVKFGKRGVYRVGGFWMESGFPFIFMTGRRPVEAETEVVVYPEIKDVDFLIKGRGMQFTKQTAKPGTGEELLYIREFRFGDDIKRVNWKASAKSDKLMLKEYSEEEPLIITVMLDNINPSNPNAFEKAVSLAASALSRFMDEGYYVRLMTCKSVTPFGNSTEHLWNLLYALAVVEESDTWECSYEDEMAGATLLVLKTSGSALKNILTQSEMVVYADR